MDLRLYDKESEKGDKKCVCKINYYSKIQITYPNNYISQTYELFMNKLIFTFQVWCILDHEIDLKWS